MHFDPWTLALQAANFLVLVWLLHRFLYKPVLQAIAARQAAADRQMAELTAKAAAAKALRKDLEAQHAAIAKERAALLAKTAADADAACEALLAKAAQDAKAAKTEAGKALERERAQAVAALGRDAARLAASIAGRLLQGGAAPAVQARMLELVCEDVRALPAETKQHIAERVAAREKTPEVITAAPLDKAAAKRFGERLAEALGGPAAPVFKVDPALVAGVEVHFPFTILRRAWSEDLRRIEAELINDDHLTNVA